MSKYPRLKRSVGLTKKFLETVQRGHAPSTDMLIALRELLPLINDALEQQAENGKAGKKNTKRLNKILAAVDGVHAGIIMGGKEKDFEMNWHYGRLLHNVGKIEEALRYLYKAQDLQPDNLKVMGRTVEALFDLHKKVPIGEIPGEHLKEGLVILMYLLTLEDSRFTRALFSKARKLAVDFLQSRKEAANAPEVARLIAAQ